MMIAITWKNGLW